MNVLIIEDELLIQKSLIKLLKKKDCQVVGKTSGREAVELIKTKSFDRIVCDLMLQDITGFDVIEESKSIYTNEEIGKKFIIITAYSSENVKNKAGEYNCPIFKKPFDNINEVITKITSTNL